MYVTSRWALSSIGDRVPLLDGAARWNLLNTASFDWIKVGVLFCSKNWYCFKKAHQIKGQNQGGSSRLVQIPTSIFLKAGREGILGEKNEAIGVQSRILVQLVFLFRFCICITEEITVRLGREEVCLRQPHLCHCLYSPSTAGASSSSPRPLALSCASTVLMMPGLPAVWAANQMWIKS